MIIAISLVLIQKNKHLIKMNLKSLWNWAPKMIGKTSVAQDPGRLTRSLMNWLKKSKEKQNNFFWFKISKSSGPVNSLYTVVFF